MTHRLFLLAALAGVLGLTGCARYQLGPGSQLAFATLYVEPVANRTLLPQAQAIVSTQLRAAFLHDGRVALVNSAAPADATLTVVIQGYRREMTAVREDDTGLARKFSVTLEVHCTLRDNRSGKVLFADRPVAVHRDAFTDGGQLQAEYQLLPLLAEALAQKVTHTVLDVW
jgi:outer membrane lipopolysaccharide assembly protein LptE/RlpB